MSTPSPIAPTFTLTVSSPPAPPHPTRRATPTTIAMCLIGLGLLANAAVLLYTHITGHAPDLILDRSALAQAAPGAGPMLGARGIYMMPAQLGNGAYGVYLLDVDAGTICVYRATPESSKFRLMAVRSFRWDVQLEDLNNDPMTPGQVQKIIEGQRQRQDLTNKGQQPTVEQSPKPDENAPDVLPGNAGAMAPGGAAAGPK